MVPTWRALWQQRRRWSRGLGRTVREHFGGVLRKGATHIPVALITVLGAAWLWASLAVGIARGTRIALHMSRGEPFFHPALSEPRRGLRGICFGFFIIQLLIAILLERARWRLYPKLFLLAPLYPIYFWGVSLTTFVVGFPQGFLRQDRGKWRRTVRNSEMTTAASAELR